MVRRMVQMTLGGVGVVRSGFVISRFVVICCLAMMPGCVFVMFGRFVMVLCRLFGHSVLLGSQWMGQAGQPYSHIVKDF
jgi:hypothetical protein